MSPLSHETSLTQVGEVGAFTALPQVVPNTMDYSTASSKAAGGKYATRTLDTAAAASGSEYTISLQSAMKNRAAQLQGSFQGAYLRTSSSSNSGGQPAQQEAQPTADVAAAAAAGGAEELSVQPAPTTVDPSALAARRRVGDAAEMLVCALLQREYGEGFSPGTGWVSSARHRMLPQTAVLGGVDDAAGYDFTVVDNRQWLVMAAGASFTTCYIEVKATFARRLRGRVLRALSD